MKNKQNMSLFLWTKYSHALINIQIKGIRITVVSFITVYESASTININCIKAFTLKKIATIFYKMNQKKASVLQLAFFNSLYLSSN